MKLANNLKKFYKKYRVVLMLLFVFLSIPAGLLYAENVFIQADRQTFDGEKTIFEGNVQVDYQDINIKSPRAIVRNDKNGKPSSATFVDGAYAVKKDDYSRSEVKANIINLSLLKDRIRAKGNAESSVFEDKKPIVHITAGSQIFDIKKNIIVASENARIDYKDIKTLSNKARISIDDKGDLEKVELLGDVEINQEKSIIKANEVLYNPVTDEMTATGNANSTTILEDGSNVVIISDFQHYDNATKTLITSGHVKIKYKDYIATGPKANFIPEKGSDKPNRIIFLGRSKIKEGQRYVEADRIEITMDPKNFEAIGNVKTRFTQVKNYKDRKKKK